MGHVKAESSPCSTPHRNIPLSPWRSFQMISGWLPIVDKPLHQWYLFRHGVSHHIVTEGWPIFAPPLHRLSPEKLVATKAEFSKLLDLGIVCPSSCTIGPLHSTWSPKAMVNGAHVGTTAGWMTSQLLIATPFRISRILHPIWLIKPSFPRWTWFAPTIRSLLPQMTLLDCHYNPIWPVRVLPHALWLTKCCPDLPAVHWQCLSWPWLCPHLPGWHLFCVHGPSLVQKHLYLVGNVLKMKVRNFEAKER